MKSARPKYITADGQVSDSPVTISGIVLTAAGDQATVTLYNESDDSKTAAKKAITIKAATNTSTVVELDIYMGEGCYADVTGTTPELTLLIR